MIGTETKYCALVRVLPAWYRADRGDEMVGALLDLHDEQDRKALWSELWAVLALGVRTRLAARAAPARTVALGDLVRQVALLGLLWDVLKSACNASNTLWMLRTLSGSYPSTFRAALTSDLITELIPLAAALIPLVLLVDGWRRLARVAAVTILAAGAIWFLVKHPSPEAAAYFAPQWLPLVLLLPAFHADAPLPPTRPWWWAIGGSLLLAPVLALRFGLPGGLDRLTGLSPLVWLCAIAGAGYLLIRLRSEPRPAWTFALALCIALALVQNLVLKNGIIPFDEIVLAQVCSAGVIVVALTVVGIRDYRRAVVKR